MHSKNLWNVCLAVFNPVFSKDTARPRSERGQVSAMPDLETSSPSSEFIRYWRAARTHIDAAILEKLPRLSHLSQHVENAVKGGKRLRATLTLLVSEALGGTVEDSLDRAVAIEFVHSASLIHDDYIDRHPVRRGNPSLWRVLDPRRAVLLADLLFSMAQLYMERKSRQDAMLLAEAIRNTVRGAILEPLNPVDIVRSIASEGASARIYETIIRLKTGELFGAAAKAGAVASAADTETQENAYRYGVKLGEAYQIADDLREVRRLQAGGRATRIDIVDLLPALFHFDRRTFRKVFFSLVPGGKLPSKVLARAMETIGDRFQEEIDRRVSSAESALDAFPRNRHTMLLKVAPRVLTDIMLSLG